MALDDDDTPKGEIIALVLIASIIVIVLVITFESCADYEKGDVYNFCEPIVIEIHPALGEQRPCFNDKGEVEFSLLNRGVFPLEGINIKYFDINVNITRPTRPISQEIFVIPLGLRTGQEYRPINVTPIVYYEDDDRDVLCERSVQRIMRLSRCGLPG